MYIRQLQYNNPQLCFHVIDFCVFVIHLFIDLKNVRLILFHANCSHIHPCKYVSCKKGLMVI